MLGQSQQRVKGFTFVDLKVLVFDVDRYVQIDYAMVYNVFQISEALMH